MAEKADPSVVPGKRPGRRKYPWHDWTDGDWWRLTDGLDYTIATTAFRSVAFNHARRHGYKIQTKQVEGGIFIRFTPIKKTESTGD